MMQLRPLINMKNQNSKAVNSNNKEKKLMK